MNKIAAYVVIGSVIIIALVYLAMKFFVPASTPAQSENPNSSIRIGFSLGDLREERWQHDRDLFVAAAQKMGAFVEVTSANSDATLQNTQVENMITQGLNPIVIAPYDGVKIGEAVAAANKAHIKIISYDRLIMNSPVDFYVTFDNVKVGRLEAQGVTAVKSSGNFAYIGGAPTDNNSELLKQGSMEVLTPLINKGAIKLVISQLTTDPSPLN